MQTIPIVWHFYEGFLIEIILYLVTTHAYVHIRRNVEIVK